MIEILLREDITAYKSKPFFGMSLRQLAVVAIVVITSIAEGYFLLVLLHLPTDIGGLFIVATAVGIAYIGLREQDGIPLTKLLLPMWRAFTRPTTCEHCVPDVVVSGPSARKLPKDPWLKHEVVLEPRTKQEAKQVKREVKLAKRDSEFIGADGLSIKPSKARKERGIKKRKS